MSFKEYLSEGTNHKQLFKKVVKALSKTKEPMDVIVTKAGVEIVTGPDAPTIVTASIKKDLEKAKIDMKQFPVKIIGYSKDWYNNNYTDEKEFNGGPREDY